MKKYFFFLFVFALLIYACSGSSGSSNDSASKDSASKPLDGAVASGKMIYNDNCRVCHGDDGKAGLNGAKDLSASTISQDVALEIITNGKNMMLAFKGRISDNDISEVAQYIMTLRK